MERSTRSFDLTEFIKEMTAVVEQTESDSERVVEAERLVGKLISNPSWLPADKQRSVSDGYARHTLYQDPLDRFEVVALAWRPGQSTPLHDHDGTWGAEGVVSGQMTVTNYVQEGTLPDGRVKLRRSGTILVNHQATGQLLPPADCHILENHGDQSAITIHVYGKQLRRFRVFEPSDDQGFFFTRDHDVEYTSQ